MVVIDELLNARVVVCRVHFSAEALHIFFWDAGRSDRCCLRLEEAVRHEQLEIGRVVVEADHKRHGTEQEVGLETHAAPAISAPELLERPSCSLNYFSGGS